MGEKRTVHCLLDQRWLFDITVKTGCVEIECTKCKNALRINFETNQVGYPKLNIVTAMSI